MSPYRQAADMPKEEDQMSDQVRAIRMCLIAAVSVVAIVAASCTANTINSNRTELIKAQYEATPEGKAVAEARANSAKYEAEKAMFQHVK